MAHYAFIDENNIVVEVIVGKDENDLPGDILSWEDHYEQFREGLKCLRTSYNTRGGVHYNPETGKPSKDQSKALRYNYASIESTYDEVADAFIPVSPYQSWVLNKETYSWTPPVPKPEDSNIVSYIWHEDSVSWIQLSEI